MATTADILSVDCSNRVTIQSFINYGYHVYDFNQHLILVSVYEPQPLLLRPPLPPFKEKALKMNTYNYFQCHEPPPSSVDSIDRKFGSNPLTEGDKALREYIGFILLAAAIVLLLLTYRITCDCCSLRRLRRLRRCLCGRPIGSPYQRLEMAEGDDETAWGSPRQPRGYVVETVHTSLTYRLVRQCLPCQQRH
ncbi:hypothetical protein Aperf_G00000121828 [Anoplocephala perfoliata]